MSWLSTRFAIAAAVVVGGVAVAGGIAYASIPDAGTGTYHACLKRNGRITIIDPSKQACNPANETEITFNQKGPQGDPGTNGANGTNGVSPSVAQLAAGNSHCPSGGAAITDAQGSTAFVCSGQGSSGTLTSPNGLYGISVQDTGVTITGPGGSVISLSGPDLTIQSIGNLTVRAAANVDVEAGLNGLVKANGTLALQGAVITQN